MLDIEYIERLVITFIVIIIGSGILYLVISSIMKQLKGKQPAGRKQEIILKAAVPVITLILILAFKLNLPLILNDAETISSLQQFTNVLLVFSGAWIAINTVKIARLIILRNFDLNEKDNLVARKMYTQLRIIERIIIFLIVFIALAIALMTFESIRRIGVSLFASAGIAGIILGLAAQRAIATILAGFQIAITQPLRIDDVVIIEGEWGRIEEITLTYVVVMIWDRRRLVVPTTYFIEKPFQNWTRVSADLMGTVFLYTDYTIPVDELRQEFKKYLKETDLWDGEVANVQVTDSTKHSLEIRFLMSANDSPTLWDLRVLIRERIVTYLQKNHPDKLPRTRVEMKP